MTEADSPQGAKAAARRIPFVVGLALFLLWVAALATLVVTSANPVVLNVRQLREADCVVVAKPEAEGSSQFERVTVIAGNEPPETLELLDIEDLTPPGSELWLLPLEERRPGVYSVVPVPYRDEELLLVYPGRDDVVQQAREVLGL